MGTLKFRHTTINSQEFLLSTKEKKKNQQITGRFFDPLKMAESITDSRIYGFTEIKPE